MAEARKIERQIARLVDRIAALAPDSKELAIALTFHMYTLFSLAMTSKRPSVTWSLKQAAYKIGAAAVTIEMRSENVEIGTVYAAYNLAIDLISVEKENRAAEGLEWLLKARALLNKLAGKKKLPRATLHFKLYYLDFSLARAYHILEQDKKAQYILKRSLALAPALSTAKFDTLRGVAQCAKLLASIYIAQKQASSRPK